MNMGTLRNFVESFPVEPMTVDVIRPYRNARFGAFALITWDAGFDFERRRNRVGYAFLERRPGAVWSILFHGADLYPSPYDCIDSAEVRETLLVFLTDPSTCETPSDAQRAFLESDKADNVLLAFQDAHGLDQECA